MQRFVDEPLRELPQGAAQGTVIRAQGMRALPAHALKAFASQTAVAGRRLGAQDRLRAQGAGRRAAEPQARQGRCC